MEKKKPDYIVYNEETGEFDAYKKQFPTTVGAPSFQPVIIDNTLSIKASKHFKSKLVELKAEYDKLIEEFEWTTLVYNSEIGFDPIVGETYHLYERGGGAFLSLIGPNEWKQKHLGTFRLSTEGKWEKV